MMAKFFRHQYVPKYQDDFYDLPWCEQDLISYIHHLKNKEMTDYPKFYLKNKEIFNFDPIHHRYRVKKTIKQ